MFYKLKIYTLFNFLGVHVCLNAYELRGTLLCKHIFVCMYCIMDRRPYITNKELN